MKSIILDTNFLLIPSQFKVDIFSEISRICDFSYELFIVDKTIEELKNINNVHSRIALQLVRNKKINKKIKIISSSGSVDSTIINVADRNTIVATQDNRLKKKLKGKVAGFIVLRQKRYLVLV